MHKTRSQTRLQGMGILLLATSGCVASDSDVLEATEGCDEVRQGNVDGLEIDGQARLFLQSTVDIEEASLEISEEVLSACAAVASDLGADDSWSELEGLQARISNGDGTGACDQAAAVVESKLAGAGEISLTAKVSKGACHVDFEAQTACEADCAANTTCEPGSVETRCEPGHISAYCEGSCEASAVCEGTVEVAAHCEGRCMAKCSGACEGVCHLDDGTTGENVEECDGVCDGKLVGECYGECEVSADAGVECGADVRCRGGCTGEIQAPTCATEYAPPSCDIDTACYQACATEAAKAAECDPTTVEILVEAEGDVEADVSDVVDTLETNLPVLFRTVEAQGKLIKSASERMAMAGGGLADNVEHFNGKAVACVTESVSVLSESLATLDVSIEASLKVNSVLEVK